MASGRNANQSITLCFFIDSHGRLICLNPFSFTASLCIFAVYPGTLGYISRMTDHVIPYLLCLYLGPWINVDVGTCFHYTWSGLHFKLCASSLQLICTRVCLCWVTVTACIFVHPAICQGWVLYWSAGQLLRERCTILMINHCLRLS